MKMVPKHSVENGPLMRMVYLQARIGPARMFTAPMVYCECPVNPDHPTLLAFGCVVVPFGFNEAAEESEESCVLAG
ncbi:hypothetical protein L914_01555 [Phytophthora nicotianae]|uniref:Uncharacterized protein n=1 Tax=Phytophthora nicotianae TaxID=4792 RepID=W2P4N5_PHYNI|nr:hypothetical protein L914_01555 [Phytophthora nicotianae]